MILYWCKDCRKYFAHSIFKKYCHYCMSKHVIEIKLKSEPYYCKDCDEWGIGVDIETQLDP